MKLHYWSLLSAVTFVFLTAGCSKTTVRLTGTPGTYYSGSILHECDPVPIKKEHRSLPDADLTFGCFLGTSARLSSCEFRKEDTNAVLAADIHTKGFSGILTAPPGTTGVRLRRQGKIFSSDVF
jgi:hypothetical protein